MLPIVFASITPFSGKNSIGMGMACKFRAEGRRVGYFKPIGPVPVWEDDTLTDQDAQFFKKALKLDEPLEVLCPVVLSDEMVSMVLRGQSGPLREKIDTAYDTTAADKDIVMVFSMGRLSCGLGLGYPMSEFVERIDAKVVVVNHFRWPFETVDGLLSMHAALGDRLAGVVFNRIPVVRQSLINQAVCPFLKNRGISCFGLVPDDTLLRAVPVRDLVESLDGHVLCCGKKLDDLVESFSIGAMNAQAALRFFRRVPNKAVITGGDRADIQLAALATSTRCLILTGGLYPNERILARAEEAGVPVILVRGDTAATADVCDQLLEQMSLRSEQKIARVTELTETHLNWELVHEKLGLS